MVNKNLEHAKHNERVCNFLNQKAEFADWIITTAFYAALHYTRHYLFPIHLTINNKVKLFDDFDKCYHYCKHNGENKDKHTFLLNLIEDNCEEIADDYNYLLDMSKNARYINYNHDRATAQAARQSLLNIKNYCFK